MNRRRFLVAGAAAGAGLIGVAGVVALETWPAPPRAPRRPLRVLDATTFGVVAAVADRVCPVLPGLPGAWDLQVAERVDDLLDRLAPGGAADVLLALRLLESPTLSLLTGGPPLPFTRMSLEQQDAKLEAWRVGRPLQRTVWKAVCSLAKGSYWSDPATHRHVGYVRPAWATP